MEYITFDKISDDFTVKYAPSNTADIVGSFSQVKSLEKWLEDYDRNGQIHRRKLSTAQHKKPTKRKAVKPDPDVELDSDTIIKTDDAKMGTDGTNKMKTDSDDIDVFAQNRKGKKEYSDASCVLVTGDHGSGKTSVVKAVLNAHNYKIRTVNFAKIASNNNNVESFTNSLLDCDGVFTFIEEAAKEPDAKTKTVIDKSVIDKSIIDKSEHRQNTNTSKDSTRMEYDDLMEDYMKGFGVPPRSSSNSSRASLDSRSRRSNRSSTSSTVRNQNRNQNRTGHTNRADLARHPAYKVRQKDKIAIIVDEIESVSSNNEKMLIDMLLEINSKKWKAPVIFISNNKHKKIITTMKKECFHIHFYEPLTTDMIRLLIRIGEGESMRFEEEATAYAIIEHSGHDYRKMISTLQMLYKVYGSEPISQEMLESYLKITDQRDVDRTIYEDTVKLFSEFKSIETTLRVFEGDKVNMPLMVHQNHYNAVSGYIKDVDTKLSTAEQITDSLAMGDIIDNYIYSDQSWGLQEVHGNYSCVFPSYILNNVADTEKLRADSKRYYRGVQQFRMDFPKDLNRTSTRKINQKNIKAASEFFPDMSVPDYVRANQLIRQLLEDGRAEECGKLIERYNLTHVGVMYVLKIDKVTGTKKVVSKDIDKLVKQITVEPVVKSKITKVKVSK